MIDADELKTWFGEKDLYSYDYIIDTINDAPTIEPARKKGKWILDKNPHDGDCRCSVCLMAIDQMHERNHGLLNALTDGKWWTFYKFCPNCGANMGKPEEETE